MTTILLLLGILFFSAFGVLIFQARHAPEGHEDADGFHFAREDASKRKVRATYKTKNVSASVRRHRVWN